MLNRLVHSARWITVNLKYRGHLRSRRNYIGVINIRVTGHKQTPVTNSSLQQNLPWGSVVWIVMYYIVLAGFLYYYTNLESTRLGKWLTIHKTILYLRPWIRTGAESVPTWGGASRGSYSHRVTSAENTACSDSLCKHRLFHWFCTMQCKPHLSHYEPKK